MQNSPEVVWLGWKSSEDDVGRSGIIQVETQVRLCYPEVSSRE